MKCQAWTRVEQRRKKGSGEGYEQVKCVHQKFVSDCTLAAGYTIRLNPLTNEQTEGLSDCGGAVAVDIRAVDEPDWGGHYATLCIEYRCTRCGNTYFPTLPGCGEEISEVVREWVERLADVVMVPNEAR